VDVKLIFFTEDVANDKAYEPLIKFNDGAAVSVKAPVRTVIAVAPLYVKSIVGVPVMVNPVIVDVSQLLPVPCTTILPDPNANVLVIALALLNVPHVNVNPFRSNVSPAMPAEKVNSLVDPIVKLATRRTVDATLSDTVIGQSIVTPAEFTVRGVAEPPPPFWKNKPDVLALHVVVLPVRSKFPATEREPVIVMVGEPADAVKFKHCDAEVMFTVYEVAEVKKTLSVLVGTDAPVGVSVELADQFAVLDQVFVPPGT